MNFREAYEFDFETYDGEGGGVAGMLNRYLQQQRQQQQGGDFGAGNDLPNFRRRRSAR